MFGGEARALGSCVCDAECLGLAVHALAVEMVGLLYILRVESENGQCKAFVFCLGCAV